MHKPAVWQRADPSTKSRAVALLKARPSSASAVIWTSEFWEWRGALPGRLRFRLDWRASWRKYMISLEQLFVCTDPTLAFSQACAEQVLCRKT